MKNLLSFAFATTLLANIAWADDDAIARGRYLVTLGGCNECHTAGFAPSEGKIPESEWLKGDPTGWYGPWGTTYATNLRLLINQLKPEGWIQLARNTKARPPMPGYILRTMKEEDLQAIYAFVRSLGSGGDLMPAALPPGEIPKGTYFNFVPVVSGDGKPGAAVTKP